MRKVTASILILPSVFWLASPAAAQQVEPVAASDKPGSVIIVTGRRANVIGVATSASEGQVSREDLADRPIQRVAELLETIRPSSRRSHRDTEDEAEPRYGFVGPCPFSTQSGHWPPAASLGCDWK